MDSQKRRKDKIENIQKDRNKPMNRNRTNDNLSFCNTMAYSIPEWIIDDTATNKTDEVVQSGLERLLKNVPRILQLYW